ncbi:unnamed protein product [Schistosoma mattheei]|uniref:Uncharacterized protein n=1 Tax=Schistosoma mattheei TaxID=31246 RepID=A0A183P0W9_9TREM|nr:unnamed protein product [Schistosoma mattheei]
MNNQLNTTNKQSTLQLYRIIKLDNEYNNNQIFTFIIPPQFIKGFLHSVQSNEFYYAGHYWYIRMEYDINIDNQYATTNTTIINNSSKQFIQYNKQPLGISLHLCHLSNGLLCHLKSIKFTIPHQYNYTLNLIHQMNNLYFTNKNLSYQLTSWIQSNLLLTNQYYLFDNDTCLLEIELNQLMTIYEEQLHISKNIKDILHCKCIESTTFTYSNNDWSFIIDWNHLFNDTTNNNTTNKDNKVIHDYRPKCYLQKHNTLKHWIRIKYLISIHWYNLGEFTTDLLDHLINPDHSSITKPLLIGDLNWFLNNTISNMIKLKHKISIKIHFYSITYINLIQLIPTLPHINQNCTQFIDPYGIEWFIISDILGKLVHLKLFYLNHSNTTYNTTYNKQLNNNEYQLQVRSTAWSIQLIPYNESLNNVKSMSPFYVIYTSMNNNTTNQTILKQNSNTNYQEIVLNLDVEKVCSSNFGYSRPSDNAITLHIEWLYSHVLCRGDYQNYDELIARQRYLLLRDISNKDSGNEHLNKLKQVQVSTSSSSKENDHHDHDTNRGKLSESNINSIKQSSYLRKSSEILSSSKSYFQDSFKIKKTSTNKGSISPNHSLSNINNLDDDSSSTNQSWRRHSSCLEEVGTNKPRQRRQLPSPPPPSVPLVSSSSSSLKLTGVILPEDVNTISSIDRYQTTRTNNNNNNSPRLSLKHEHSDFDHFI